MTHSAAMSETPIRSTAIAAAPTVADREWFEREILAALPELYGTAMRFARHRADAEDLVADAVARSWTQLHTLQDRGRFRGWIFRILTNAFISACRARASAPAMETLEPSDDAPAFSLFEPLHQPFLLWWSNPEQEFLNNLLREDLERAVDGLPDVYRLPVVMADVQGMSYQEIADGLGCPIGTVRSRLARGRSLLQRALWDHAADAGLVRPHTNRSEAP